MAYGDYDGPNKADKGQKHGSCNRTRCQDSSALWYNHGSFAWYCESCMRQIYDGWGRRNWKESFPKINFPQFETEEMMIARGANIDPTVY